MGRPARETSGGFVFHVLFRGVGRRTLFEKADDFFALDWIIGCGGQTLLFVFKRATKPASEGHIAENSKRYEDLEDLSMIES